MNDRVGFIGLGVMGREMARNVSRSKEVVGFDPDQSRFDGLSGVERAASVEEIAQKAEFVLLSLPKTEVVSAVVEGDRGLLPNLREGQIVVDLSTTAPEETRRLASRLAGKGVGWVDAPVSGGQAGAESATLSVMCGGTEKLYNTVRPILACIGSSVVRVGETGAGQVAKLANNMIVGAAFVSAVEAFALAATADIDPSTLCHAIRGGWAGSPVLDVTAKALSTGDYNPGGTVDLLSKDLGYARSLARSETIPMPVTAIVDEVFTAARARGDGDKAQPVIVQMWEELTGRRIAGKERTT